MTGAQTIAALTKKTAFFLKNRIAGRHDHPRRRNYLRGAIAASAAAAKRPYSTGSARLEYK